MEICMFSSSLLIPQNIVQLTFDALFRNIVQHFFSSLHLTMCNGGLGSLGVGVGVGGAVGARGQAGPSLVSACFTQAWGAGVVGALALGPWLGIPWTISYTHNTLYYII